MMRLGFVYGGKIRGDMDTRHPDPHSGEGSIHRSYGTMEKITVPFGHATPGVEVDTGVDLPDKGIVMDAIVEVETADVGITIDVGVLSTEGGGDPDGLVDGLAVASTGLKQTTKTADASGGQTVGDLLKETEIESADSPPLYEAKPKFHLTDSVAGKSISYTVSAGADTAVGKIHIMLMELP